MNGFKLMADSYRKAAEDGKIFKEEADKNIRIFEFLATCDEDDFCMLFDSSAFNEIAKSYLRLTVSELISEDMIDKDQGRDVRNRFSLLLDEKKASEVI